MKTLKELIIEYSSSDSISRRNELREPIENICEEYISAKDKIASKYHVKVIDDSDYQSSRGGWTLEDDACAGFDTVKDDYFVDLNYKDSWSYGGYCNISHTFYVKEVENFDPVKYEKYCQAIKLRSLKADVSKERQNLAKAEEKLAKFLVDIG